MTYDYAMVWATVITLVPIVVPSSIALMIFLMGERRERRMYRAPVVPLYRERMDANQPLQRERHVRWKKAA